jgi:hypothetical protein
MHTERVMGEPRAAAVGRDAVSNGRRRGRCRFPVGKSRMQPLGIIVFSSIMGTVGFQVSALTQYDRQGYA